MQQRQLGPFQVTAVGMGCMNLSHAYGIPPSASDASAVLLHALELGVTHFDTAALYGFGVNEELLGRVLSPHRASFTLASKCGIQGIPTESGVRRAIDGRPATLTQTCEAALKRLRTDVIDLYYLHRWDKRVPIEDSVGALAELKQQGKIRAIGLSEVSASTLRRAHAVHPIAAVQSEYSLTTRNPEIAVLDTCHELGVTFVAFSPLARGYLSGALSDISILPANDIRRAMPRFSAANHDANLRLLGAYQDLAEEACCTLSQLAVAWVLTRGSHVVAIPGTSRIEHVTDNAGAGEVSLSNSMQQRLDTLINRSTICGDRYNASTQAEIDTESFPAAT